MVNILVERKEKDLKRVWEFTLLVTPNKLELLCTKFILYNKIWKDWSIVNQYNTYFPRLSNIKVTDFNIPKDVLNEAFDQLVKLIVIDKWNK